MTNPDEQYSDNADSTPTQKFPTQAYSAERPHFSPTEQYTSEYAFPEEVEAAKDDNFDSIPVPNDSDTGRLIHAYLNWANEQDFPAKDMNTVDRFLQFPSLYQHIPADNPRYILSRWVDGDIVLMDDKKKDNTPTIIVSAIAILALLGIIIAFFVYSGTKKDKDTEDPFASVPSTSQTQPTKEKEVPPAKPKKKTTVAVPNLEGKTLAAAKSILAQQRIGIDAVYTQDDDVFSGDAHKAIVMGTNPNAGTQIEKNDASVSIVVKVLKTPKKEKPVAPPTVTKTETEQAPAPKPTKTQPQPKPTETTPQTTEEESGNIFQN